MTAPDLRQAALHALQAPDPTVKVALVSELIEKYASYSIASVAPKPTTPLPGRPARPRLVEPRQVPHRSPFTPEGLAALVHAVAHIEFNAINLALDAIWRFDGLPDAYYRDWLRVAAEEAHHFTLLTRQLARLGMAYGDADAHDGLWLMCERTAHDATARMALVPRTLEARGLDASPPMQARLRQVGTPEALNTVAILDVILRDEIGHVAVGNRWYRWLCARHGLDPVAHYARLVAEHCAPQLKPPFNTEARRAAGFTEAELDWLARHPPSPGEPAPAR